MIKKYKLILVANTFVFFKVFLLNHIKYLSKKYDIFIICNNSIELKELIPRNVSLININFKRGFNFIHDVLSFFMILYFFLILRPSSSISFTPKIGFMVAIASFIARTSFRIHWYTGQIWANKSGFKKLFYKLIDRLIFFFSHKVLVDGFSQRKFLINENVICKSNSFVLHKGSVGGVDISRFKLDKEKRIELRKKYSISNNTFVFLYLGRINKEKGIVELIKAFKKIKKINNVLLIIVGPLEDTELLSLLKKKKILYFTYTNKPEEWFSLADILCLPSHREGFGTVVIEAGACGIPSLCSDIYGLNDIVINNKTGFFHDVGNVKDIYSQMEFIIKNKKFVKKIGNNCKKKVLKDFNQNLITRKLLKFLNLYAK